MKTLRKLSEKELTETNGGSTNNSTSNNLVSLLQIDNLLTVSIETQNGDRSSKHTLSVGNDINANANGSSDQTSY